MEIIIAKNAGYCFGVKRAVEITQETLKKYKGKEVFSLGDIIHNPQVVERLKTNGLKVAKEPNEVTSNSIVIISAHGSSEDYIKRLEKKGCKIINATCPYVKLPQNIIKRLTEENYYIILFGDKDHPEVKGLLSYSNGKDILVIDNDKFNLNSIEATKVGILAQTTQSKEKFFNTVCKLVERFKETRVFNTICDATEIRQNEAINIAKNVDIMIVIGGRNSANTKRLYEISKKYCKKVIHIETADELSKKVLQRVKKVGITAGASTPDDIIKDVISRIKIYGL